MNKEKLARLAALIDATKKDSVRPPEGKELAVLAEELLHGTLGDARAWRIKGDIDGPVQIVDQAGNIVGEVLAAHAPLIAQAPVLHARVVALEDALLSFTERFVDGEANAGPRTYQEAEALRALVAGAPPQTERNNQAELRPVDMETKPAGCVVADFVAVVVTGRDQHGVEVREELRFSYADGGQTIATEVPFAPGVRLHIKASPADEEAGEAAAPPFDCVDLAYGRSWTVVAQALQEHDPSGDTVRVVRKALMTMCEIPAAAGPHGDRS